MNNLAEAVSCSAWGMYSAADLAPVDFAQHKSRATANRNGDKSVDTQDSSAREPMQQGVDTVFQRLNFPRID